jgi:hypothetical protein
MTPAAAAAELGRLAGVSMGKSDPS